MSYLGKTQLKSSDIQRFDVTSSTSATHVLGWTAPNDQSLIITINGVKQQDDAYSIAGSPTTVTLTDALVSTDKLEVVGIVDVGTMNVPGVGSVQTDQLADDAVTADKLANSINTEIAANTAKVTNATHTGDVTGATALTIANDAVDIAMLSATGTASATTFLRGDNAWAAPTGGLTEADCWVMTTTFTDDAKPIASNWARDTSDGFGLLGTGMTESSGVFTFPSTGHWQVDFHLMVQIPTDFEERTGGVAIYVSINAGVDYEKVKWAATASNFLQSTQTYHSSSCSTLVDVTNTSNFKIQFWYDGSNSSTQVRGTSDNETYVIFKKLADT